MVALHGPQRELKSHFHQTCILLVQRSPSGRQLQFELVQFVAPFSKRTEPLHELEWEEVAECQEVGIQVTNVVTQKRGRHVVA